MNRETISRDLAKALAYVAVGNMTKANEHARAVEATLTGTSA